ncbi:hypothetical protein T12_2375 [Trichinella patagoniensis]|uniref:Uncharacterized protein n=1 Tax=Trichinella patagoniensis TaxID=990121 RepID=A0A0V0ZGF1_9BILA|nr:hypothetical protein T12_2375 [Trichinella patagoniensis]
MPFLPISILISHLETCIADDSILYKIEKRNTLKRRAREETKPVPQIYREECSSASTSLETAGHFPTHKKRLEIPAYWRVTKSGRLFFTYNNANDSVLIFCTEENLRELAAHSVWCRDGIFKIVPEWVVFQAQPLICNFETALIPVVQGSFPGVHVQLSFLPTSSAEVADLGLRGNKEKITMLMATAFLPLAEVPDAVDLLCRDVADSLAALRLQLQNEPASRKTSLNFYELLRLLIDEQGSTETLIQQLTSGRVTVNGLRVKNNKCEEVQLRIAAMTAEYDGGTRTMEQFLRAVAYDVPEPVNF